jgi:hypothetical protein
MIERIPPMSSLASKSRMLLVLSSERSGSTLLTRMLGRHPAIMAPSELWLLRYPDFEKWRAEKPQAIHSLGELAPRLNLPQDAVGLTERFGKSDTLSIYQNLLALAPAGSVIVDKTPAYANETAILKRSLALDPCYIRLMRHPLGVIDSETRLVEKRLIGSGGNGLTRRIKLRFQRCLNRGFTRQERRREEKWLMQNRNIEAFLGEIPPDRKTTIVFEDMLLDPEKHLAAVCGMLGLPFDEAMLDPFADTADIKPGLGNPNFHTRARIETAPIHSWRERYSPRQLKPATLEFMKRAVPGGWQD